MPGLYLYMSNRLETLAGRLAETMRNASDDPLAAETVMVQSKGMEKWLSMRIADSLGVCANVEFPYPNALVWRAFRSLIPDMPEDDPYCKELLAWRVYSLLPSCAGMKGFEAPAKYLSDPGDLLRRYQLAHEIADSLDQYAMYRPSLLAAWEAGEGDHWQAALWRVLRRDNPGPARVDLKQRFIRALNESGGFPRGDFPSHLSLFGVSSLPSFHVEVLAAISAFVEVRVFMLSPTPGYWGDLITPKKAARIEKLAHERQLSFEDLHYEQGNSLLASLGILGRDFLTLLINNGCDHVSEDRDSVAPERRSLLSMIQSDIFDMKESGSDGVTELPAEDCSLTIHCCHSAMREVESLHDFLLSCFEGIKYLEPRDICVMTPDIETYLPFINAVFGDPSDPSHSMPYSIADRRMVNASRVASAFHGILTLADGRFQASAVAELLECPELARRFGIGENDLPTVRRWIADTRIRWGVDEDDRRTKNLPPYRENTWMAGIDRMLLGVALPEGDGRLFQGIAPYGMIEGAETELLGNFLNFIEVLVGRVSALRRERSLDEWSDLLVEMIEGFFGAGDDDGVIRALRERALALRKLKDESGCVDPVDMRVVAYWMMMEAGEPTSGGTFLRGGITFCSMLPMRSIPFRVICLLGLNDGAYPHREGAAAFNLLRGDYRPGDRSPRLDDRYVFLEAMISARERLYLSYVGRNIIDNRLIPPSVLVSELCDCIDRGYAMNGGPASGSITFNHRLQPFSLEYFQSGGRLFTYSSDRHAAAKARYGGMRLAPPFFNDALPQPERGDGVSVDELVRFFQNPCRALLERRLGIVERRESEGLEDSEPFDIDGLTRYQIENEMLRRFLEHGGDDAALERFRARGELPHGGAGVIALRPMTAEARDMANRVREIRGDSPAERSPVDITIGAHRLTGEISDLWPGGALIFRMGKLRAVDRLSAWITHCVLNACGKSVQTMFLTRDATMTMEPYAGAEDALAGLLGWYDLGMTRPIPFFPRASLACAEAIQSGKDSDSAIRSAYGEWHGGYGGREAESADFYIKRCFGHTDPLDGGFIEVACSILGPMLECQTVEGA